MWINEKIFSKKNICTDPIVHKPQFCVLYLIAVSSVEFSFQSNQTYFSFQFWYLHFPISNEIRDLWQWNSDRTDSEMEPKVISHCMWVQSYRAEVIEIFANWYTVSWMTKAMSRVLVLWIRNMVVLINVQPISIWLDAEREEVKCKMLHIRQNNVLNRQHTLPSPAIP